MKIAQCVVGVSPTCCVALDRSCIIVLNFRSKTVVVLIMSVILHFIAGIADITLSKWYACDLQLPVLLKW